MQFRQINLYVVLCFIIGIMVSKTAFSDDNDQGSKVVGEQGIGYLLQPGDVLQISVWKEAELIRTVQINPDGKISFPLVGHIQTAGLTAEDLETLLTEKINKYIPDSVLNVSLNSATGNTVYVLGKVAQPGSFNATSYSDVMQALSRAGGLTPFAAANDIKILRRIDGKETFIPFRYSDVEAGKNLEQNIILKSGDVVVVP